MGGQEVNAQAALKLSVYEFVGGEDTEPLERFTHPTPIVVELAGETYQLYGARPFDDTRTLETA
jgi:hypothetical protein